jgi:hypothetical protein
MGFIMIFSCMYTTLKRRTAGHQRLRLIISATWEAEMGGSWFKASLGKKCLRPILTNN